MDKKYPHMILWIKRMLPSVTVLHWLHLCLCFNTASWKGWTESLIAMRCPILISGYCNLFGSECTCCRNSSQLSQMMMSTLTVQQKPRDAARTCSRVSVIHELSTGNLLWNRQTIVTNFNIYKSKSVRQKYLPHGNHLV